MRRTTYARVLYRHPDGSTQKTPFPAKKPEKDREASASKKKGAEQRRQSEK